jgi:HD-GYP domain-containing protein (c-di-GMP phosphodiesterase class II)
MVTDRPYRAGRTPAEAHAELRRVSDSQLHAPVVEALLAELTTS